MSTQLRGLAQRTSKKLIVCCDGTWRDSGSGIFSGTFLSWIWRGKEQPPTNIAKLSQAIGTLDEEGRQQIVYYQAGVGSSGNLIQRVVGGALGVGLSSNIREAYSFIANNYLDGDEIFLLGFSRGAFTARAVGGMIDDFGLLTTDGQEHIADIHEDWEHAGQDGYKTLLGQDEDLNFPVKKGVKDPKEYVRSYRAALLALKYTLPEEIPIKAIGVFETVGSLGIPVNPFFQRLRFPTVIRVYRFYNTDLGKNVENAFQALALDEKRSPYRPVLWQKLPGNEANMKQTWFPGVHSDVGGGHPDSGLSNISLAWMMSNLASLLHFTPGYIERQNVRNQAHLRRTIKSESALRTGLEWAGGQLQNSTAGFHALLGIEPRTPGQYCSFNKKDLMINKGKPLQNTNESVHFSVRSREKTGGLDDHNRTVAYKPESLNYGESGLIGSAHRLIGKVCSIFGKTYRQSNQYQLDEEGPTPGEARWHYTGKQPHFIGKILPEDGLGDIEKKIFVNELTQQK